MLGRSLSITVRELLLGSRRNCPHRSHCECESAYEHPVLHHL